MNSFKKDEKLICASCGSENLHQQDAGVFFRRKQNWEEGQAVEINSSQLKKYSNMDRNPSISSDGIRICFSCDKCSDLTYLTIVQYENSTYLNTFTK